MKLINAQEGKTKALRQWRFNSVKEIEAESKTIKQYLEEAIQSQKAGKEIKPAKKSPAAIPELFNEAFKKNAKLKKSFDQLTPFKQREYCEYIAEAKRETTKISRLEKIVPMILKKNGLNEKYR